MSGNHEIEIWGDGEQTRSFMYIDDCVYGTEAILNSGIEYPINLGSSELVSINQLVDIVSEIAGITVERHHDPHRAPGPRPQQRQHAHQGGARLGAEDQAAGRPRAHLPLDPRRTGRCSRRLMRLQLWSYTTRPRSPA